MSTMPTSMFASASPRPNAAWLAGGSAIAMHHGSANHVASTTSTGSKRIGPGSSAGVLT